MKERACPECGASFTPDRRDQLFCCRSHKTAFLNRGVKRGAKLYALAYRWRALRSTDPAASNQALSRLCGLIAEWTEHDRNTGRSIPSEPELPPPGFRCPPVLGSGKLGAQPWHVTATK